MNAPMTPPRVLVVDDNPLNVVLAAHVLQSDGFDVDSAEDAAVAIDRITRQRPDVVLMDIQMPDIDGLAALHRLRASALGQGLVIVAFTAYAMKGDEHRLLAAGFDGYIAKPIDVATFGRTVRTYVRP